MDVDDSEAVEDQKPQPRLKDYVAEARKILPQPQPPRFSERAIDWRWPNAAAKADFGNAEDEERRPFWKIEEKAAAAELAAVVDVAVAADVVAAAEGGAAAASKVLRWDAAARSSVDDELTSWKWKWRFNPEEEEDVVLKEERREEEEEEEEEVLAVDGGVLCSNWSCRVIQLNAAKEEVVSVR
jgi:hypothetical protein